MTPTAAVRGAFAAACRQRGIVPPSRLRIGAAGSEFAEAGHRIEPQHLGPIHEQALADADRRAQGSWYTQLPLARTLVDLAVRRPGIVVDPACGGGVFLLAAVERLVALGLRPGDAVRSVRGADIDPGAVAVTEAALWLWSSDRGEPTVPAEDHLVALDALASPGWRPDVPAVAVVGNPPFLGQLRRRTTFSPGDRAALQRRFGSLVRAYTDPAWLFLVAATEMVEAGGAVCLVQPQSVLSARDAAPVRAHLDARAPLVDCWIGRGDEFGAAVNVCAPLLEVGADRAAIEWTAPAADSAGVPLVALADSNRTLADIARVVAGFRADYYGLVDAVDEAAADDPRPKLVTTGSIDPLVCRWGQAPTKFAKRSWERPVVDVERADTRGRSWITGQAAPKIVVATQTRVVEGTVDPHGSLVASVPALAVIPNDDHDLWRVAAMLHAPPVSAWCRRRTAGNGMSPTSMRVTGPLLGAIPLPTNHDAWTRAADLAEQLHVGRGSWEQFSVVAAAAYDIDDPDLDQWWHQQRPRRAPLDVTSPS